MLFIGNSSEVFLRHGTGGPLGPKRPLGCCIIKNVEGLRCGQASGQAGRNRSWQVVMFRGAKLSHTREGFA